jgi:hypothetical protein
MKNSSKNKGIMKIGKQLKWACLAGLLCLKRRKTHQYSNTILSLFDFKRQGSPSLHKRGYPL